MKLSSYQEAIMKAFKSGRSLIIEALSGSGKTTTIVELAKATNKKCLFLAFNRHIADELQARLPKVHVKTSHALGLQSIKSVYGGVKISPHKVNRLHKKFGEKAGLSRFEFEVIWDLARLVCPRWESSSVRMQSTEDALAIALNKTVNISNWVQEATLFNEQLAKDKGQIDYVDMLWLVPRLGLRQYDYDVVFVDECQDLSSAQLMLIKTVIKPTAQLVFVGDSWQSLYGFAGAGSDNFPVIRELFNINTTLPLPICYRCPDSHIEIAQRYVPQLESTGKQGTVDYLPDIDVHDIKDSSMVIGKTYKEITPLLLKCAIDDIPVTLRGVDCFAGILSAIKDGGTIEESLSEYKEETAERLENTPRLPCTKDRIRELESRIDSADAFLDADVTKDKAIAILERIRFSKKDAITFSTVHRAKGNEAESVYLIGSETFLEAKDNEDLKVNYVGVTRAKQHLTFIG